MTALMDVAVVSALHIPRHRQTRPDSLTPTAAPRDTQTERLAVREIVHINADNYETKVDEIAETLRNVLRQSYEQTSAGRTSRHTLRHRQALGAFSVTLETYVLSGHAARSSDVMHSQQVDKEHAQLRLSMTQAGR